MRFLPLNDSPLAHGPAVEQAIRQYHLNGRSVHDCEGVILAPLLEHLRHSRRPFVLTFIPGVCYIVEAGKDAAPPPAMVTATLIPERAPLAACDAPVVASSLINEVAVSLEQFRAENGRAPTRIALTCPEYEAARRYMHFDKCGQLCLMGIPVAAYPHPVAIRVGDY